MRTGKWPEDIHLRAYLSLHLSTNETDCKQKVARAKTSVPEAFGPKLPLHPVNRCSKRKIYK